MHSVDDDDASPHATDKLRYNSSSVSSRSSCVASTSPPSHPSNKRDYAAAMNCVVRPSASSSSVSNSMLTM